MSAHPVLELSSFNVTHPHFAPALLNYYGPSLVYRLSADPIPALQVGSSRDIEIDVKRQPGGANSEVVNRSISWAGESEIIANAMQFCPCIPEQDVTENAAIAIMALLVSDLEGARLRSVLPIGASADYLMDWASSGEEVRVEVSGLHSARWRSDSRSRLAEKTTQLLAGNECGYVSVSTFCYPPDATVHSFLHFVRRQDPKPEKRGKMKGRGDTMPVTSDHDSQATLASLEGGTALLKGDVATARAKHGEAGELLLARARKALKSQDRHLYTLLAATQFFKGGDYRRAAQLAARVEVKFLDPTHRDLLPGLIKQARERAAPNYPADARRAMLELWNAGRAADLLQALYQHPYLMSPDALAFVRAALCERMRNFPAAAGLFGLAYQLQPRLLYATMAAGYLFYMTGEGHFADAIDYGRLLAKSLPHPVVPAALSVAFLQAARLKPENERTPLFREQIRWFDAAKEGYRKLPPGEKDDRDVRDFLMLAHDSAAMAHLGLGEDDAAAAVSDAARDMWPSAAHLWTSRGLAAASREEGVSYFRRAAELGDESYTPYYFLAMDAYDQADYQAALHWAREALSRSQPEQQGAARLHGLVAGCIDLAGGDRREADQMFRRAIELDPQDAVLQEAYRGFLADPQTHPRPRPRQTQWRERSRDLNAYPVPARLRRAADTAVGRVLEAAGA